MPISFPSRLVSTGAAPSANIPGCMPRAQPQHRFIGNIDDIREAFPSRQSPAIANGALQGEGVTATYRDDAQDNYLYSVNAQTCVIATLYNPDTQSGAVIHFDHNISHLIDEAIGTALTHIGSSAEPGISATLCGGIWFGAGESVGAPVQDTLRRYDIWPSWDQWSFSPCTEHNYGVVLDLKQGDVTLFEHSGDAVDRLLTPLLREAQRSREDRAELARAREFMTRFESPAIMQTPQGFAFTQPIAGMAVTQEAVAAQGISIYRV